MHYIQIHIEPRLIGLVILIDKGLPGADHFSVRRGSENGYKRFLMPFLIPDNCSKVNFHPIPLLANLSHIPSAGLLLNTA